MALLFVIIRPLNICTLIVVVDIFETGKISFVSLRLEVSNFLDNELSPRQASGNPK